MSALKETGKVVVIGGGLAAAKAVEALCAHDAACSAVVIAAEDHLPYERPPLSKEYLRGEAEFSAEVVHDAEWYSGRSVDVRTGARAVKLDRESKHVVLQGGERVPYDALVLATGSVPTAPAVPGADLGGVHVLRTKEHSDALRASFTDGTDVVVVGGGWIGMEAAASARQAGANVTLVLRGEQPLAGAIGEDLGAFYASVHEAHGVRILRGANVAQVLGEDGAASGVRLESGEELPASVVLFGLGAAPALELAAESGLSVGDGVEVDEHFVTSDPAIVAVGDVASYPHPRWGRIRVEHWDAALNQPAAAVAGLLGAGAPYDHEPYFFSDQYDTGMEFVGHVPNPRAATPLIRGDLDSGEFVALWLDEDDALIASMNVNTWDVVDQVLPLIRSHVALCPKRLVDPAIPYEQATADLQIPPAPEEG